MRAIGWMRRHLKITVGVIVVLLVIGSIENLAATASPSASPGPSSVALFSSAAPTPSIAAASAAPTAEATLCYFGGNAYECDSPEPTLTPAPTAAICEATGGPLPCPTPAPATCDPAEDYCNFKPRVLLNKSSSDSHILGWTLPAADDGATVDLAYSYRCSGSGNFIINTYGGDVGIDEWYVNELDNKGHGTVENQIESAGATRIQVISECSWTIKVTAKPDPNLIGS